MLTMYEALARDRMSQAEQHARERRLVRELAATRRWRRVARYADRVQRRHAQRLREVMVA